MQVIQNEIAKYQQFNQDDMFALKQNMYKIEVHEGQIAEEQAKVKALQKLLADTGLQIKGIQQEQKQSFSQSQVFGKGQSALEGRIAGMQKGFELQQKNINQIIRQLQEKNQQLIDDCNLSLKKFKAKFSKQDEALEAQIVELQGQIPTIKGELHARLTQVEHNPANIRFQEHKKSTILNQKDIEFLARCVNKTS